MDADNTVHFTGGARLDFYNVSWPFAELEVSDCLLTIEALGKRYEFAVADIRRLSRCKGLISSGLQIEHGMDAPTTLIFWTWSWRRVCEALESRGYKIGSSRLG